MFEATLETLAALTGGTILQGHPAQTVRGVFTDTRAPLPGGIFLAIRGERFDGHEFLGQAAGAGAGAVLLDRREALDAGALETFPACGAVLVRECRSAYLALGAAHRAFLGKRGRPRWLAVTGSAGKSTVKDMLAGILSRSGSVHRAVKSFNNEIGVPATILGAAPTHYAAVLELGTNHPGEIERLARVARPQIAVINNAGRVHLEALGSVEGVAREKGMILAFQEIDDVAVLNADDPHLSLWKAMARGRVLTFGFSDGAGVHGTLLPNGSLRLSIDGHTAMVRLVVPGAHNARNALAAAAAAHAADAPLDTIVAGLEAFNGVARRLAACGINGVTLIDDAYNANPESFAAALDVLAESNAARRFVVAGDMLELGADALPLHAALGEQIAALDPQALLTVGALANHAGKAAVRAGLGKRAWIACTSPEAAAERLAKVLRHGDAVLVKGSNGMRLERCLEALKAVLARRPASKRAARVA